MRTYAQRSLLDFSLLVVVAHAFRGPVFSARPTTVGRSALIYGWDGQLESDDTLSSSPLSYLDVANDVMMSQTCSPVGSAVAEALSVDGDRTKHLARLAVAFSPPERALRLDAIESVEVVCVHDDSIEIQAVVCQGGGGGCVSLSVPVTFPRGCRSAEHGHDPRQLEGCILKNLDELDAHAGTVLQQQQLQEGNWQLINDQFQAFPDWWIPPERSQANLGKEDCETVRAVLNDDEFQSDLKALAQNALDRIEDDWRVLQARVAIVGPAGLCFKVRAQKAEGSSSVQILDVVHPFDQVITSADALRAAVLGAIAAAEGS